MQHEALKMGRRSNVERWRPAREMIGYFACPTDEFLIARKPDIKLQVIASVLHCVSILRHLHVVLVDMSRRGGPQRREIRDSRMMWGIADVSFIPQIYAGSEEVFQS